MRKPFTIQLDEETRQNFDAVAHAAHTDDTKYAAQWISELSTLKPEFALKALGLIPPEWKHRRPGRPTGSQTTSRKDGTVAEQNVA